MNRSARHSLATVLVVVAACPTLATAQTLVVQVDNDARMPAADLAQTENVVGHSFHAISVRVIWEHNEVPLDDLRGPRVHLRLLSRTNADRKIAKERIANAVLGQTVRPARLVYIFFHRIVEASVKYSHEYTRILGLVVAHELGHALLPAGSHSESGVMKGRANLWGKLAHEFTPEEGEAIRAELRGRLEAANEWCCWLCWLIAPRETSSAPLLPASLTDEHEASRRSWGHLVERRGVPDHFLAGRR